MDGARTGWAGNGRSRGRKILPSVRRWLSKVSLGYLDRFRPSGGRKWDGGVGGAGDITG